jgi:hypothetical protein
VIEDYLLDQVVAVAEERHLSESTLAAYRRTWLNSSFGRRKARRYYCQREAATSPGAGLVVGWRYDREDDVSQGA